MDIDNPFPEIFISEITQNETDRLNTLVDGPNSRFWLSGRLIDRLTEIHNRRFTTYPCNGYNKDP